MCGYSCAGRIPFADEVRCNVAGALPVCEVVTCEAGYYRASETVCAAVTSNICAPCLTDRNCPVRGDRCLALDTGLVCGQDCAADNLHGTAAGVCPNGFVCEDFPELGEGVRQCVPQSGSCSCLAEHADNTRFCSQTNEFGTCTGFESCDPLSGWEGCSATAPAPELCDRRDNDCDGTVDEGFPDLNTPCTVGTGACFRAGVVRCADEGGGTVCGAAPGDPAAEVCNYQDDDCDGQTDQTFRDEATGLYVNFDHCGSCNISCEGAILFATQTACQIQGASAVCIALECQGDYLLAENRRACLPRSGAYDCSRCLDDTQCESLAGGRCEQFADGRFCTRACAVEADCQDGFDCVNGRCLPISLSCQCLSVHAGDVRVCFDSNEAGTCVGTQTCDPLKTPGWSDCSAPEPAPEECDGVDNDCNGVTDEAVQPPDGSFACQQQNELGTCLGIQVCEGLGGWRCTARVPAAESCNGIDDDCDGLVDEDFRYIDGQGQDLGPGEVCDGIGQCGTGEVECRTGRLICSTDPGGSTPEDHPESCNGLDDDCDGVVDPPTLVPPPDVCRTQGVCAGTLPVCEGELGWECPYPATYRPEDEGPSCDSLDNDCDGLTDEGFTYAQEDGSRPAFGEPCDGLGGCGQGRVECAAGQLVCSTDPPGSGSQAMAELCNGVDDDCDGALPAAERDEDGDGVPACLGDCDDDDPAVHSGLAAQPSWGQGGLSSLPLPAVAPPRDWCGDGRDYDCSGEDDRPCVGVRLAVGLAPARSLLAHSDGRRLFIGQDRTASTSARLHQLDLVDSTLSTRHFFSVPNFEGAAPAVLVATEDGGRLYVLDTSRVDLWEVTLAEDLADASIFRLAIPQDQKDLQPDQLVAGELVDGFRTLYLAGPQGTGQLQVRLGSPSTGAAWVPQSLDGPWLLARAGTAPVVAAASRSTSGSLVLRGFDGTSQGVGALVSAATALTSWVGEGDQPVAVAATQSGGTIRLRRLLGGQETTSNHLVTGATPVQALAASPEAGVLLALRGATVEVRNLTTLTLLRTLSLESVLVDDSPQALPAHRPLAVAVLPAGDSWRGYVLLGPLPDTADSWIAILE